MSITLKMSGASTQTIQAIQLSGEVPIGTESVAIYALSPEGSQSHLSDIPVFYPLLNAQSSAETIDIEEQDFTRWQGVLQVPHGQFPLTVVAKAGQFTSSPLQVTDPTVPPAVEPLSITSTFEDPLLSGGQTILEVTEIDGWRTDQGNHDYANLRSSPSQAPEGVQYLQLLSGAPISRQFETRVGKRYRIRFALNRWSRRAVVSVYWEGERLESISTDSGWNDWERVVRCTQTPSRVAIETVGGSTFIDDFSITEIEG